ncbi:hypothetical protein K503DRAFT_374864 [Rhizopogon vinicolor AM-OR11-026]|uniref:DUF3533 domain-containing protein n=1 Tax=Rhizopogon vinicolor AM-OR11-026 TaxID=1314800 RepID=A0A1B7NBU1_9AGAM|nr:hypothetical protein K503DRAFT_374864 [Rhizopogon vinicolor AM-OR11-026]
MTKTRQEWFKSSFIGLACIWIIIWGILPMYWGALGRWSANIHNLSAYVVDFDGGDIGQAVTLAISTIRSDSQLSYLFKDAVDFPGGTGEIAQALRNDECWVAITINPGASSNLSRAIESADATYNTTQAVTAYLTSARNENIYRDVITPQVSSLLTNISQTFASRHLAGLATRQNLPALMAAAPVLVTQPLSFIINDIVPFDVPVASVVDYTGLMYMLIMSFILTLQLLSARVETGLGRRIRLGPLIGVRLFWPPVIYFLVTLMYSLLSLVFGIPFNRKFGHAGFFIYWMMSWCTMTALGLGLETMLTVLTMKFIPIFLILWIISNVSVVYYPIEVLPAIFRYGYATPFYNNSITTRTIIFGTKNQVGLNFGVQFAWICVSCITLPIVQSLACKHELKEWYRVKQGTQEGKVDV